MTNTIIRVSCEDNTIPTQEIVYMVLFIQLWKKIILNISLRTRDQNVSQLPRGRRSLITLLEVKITTNQQKVLENKRETLKLINIEEKKSPLVQFYNFFVV